MSHLRHVLIIAACVAALTQSAHVQEHPDFTGTWRVDRVDMSEPQRSDRGDRDFGRGGGGGRGGRGGLGRRGGGRLPGGARDRDGRGLERGAATLSEGELLRISQSEERLIITRDTPEGAVMTSYTLDGKETKNHPSPDEEVTSKTRWDGVALVTDSTQSIASRRGDISIKTRELLTLSDDRDTLTSTMTDETRLGKRTVTTVLSRVQQ